MLIERARTPARVCICAATAVEKTTLTVGFFCNESLEDGIEQLVAALRRENVRWNGGLFALLQVCNVAAN